MARIKICPNLKCNYHNSSTANECKECGADLFGVDPVVEEAWLKQQAQKIEAEKQAEELLKDENNSQSETVKVDKKICPNCGKENSIVAKVCIGCSYVIKGVKSKSIADNQELKTNSCSISLKLNSKNEEIVTLDESRPIIVVGRENFLGEYLVEKNNVSRKHAQLMLINGRLHIKDIKSLNGTFINDVKIAHEQLMELKNGDRVSLGGYWPKDLDTSLVGSFTVVIS